MSAKVTTRHAKHSAPIARKAVTHAPAPAKEPSRAPREVKTGFAGQAAEGAKKLAGQSATHAVHVQADLHGAGATEHAGQLFGFRATASDRSALRSLLGDKYAGTKQYAEIFRRENVKLKGISDESLVGLYVYSLEGVPGMSYREVNAALRHGPEAERKKLFALAKAVADALTGLPAFEGAVYRGAQLDAQSIARYAPGATVSEPSFTSTSVDKKIAKKFATEQKVPPGKTAVMFTLESKSGRELPFSRFPGEREVLFQPGTQFRVAKSELKGGVLYVKLSEP
jgi:hypothetical protein